MKRFEDLPSGEQDRILNKAWSVISFLSWCSNTYCDSWDREHCYVPAGAD